MFGPIKKSARLVGWDGRRRSSRHEAPVLPRLWRPAVLRRLAAVLATTLTAALLAFQHGPNHIFRAGETYSYDIRARAYFEMVNVAETARRRDEAIERIPPDLRTEVAVTAAQGAIGSVIDRYPPGALLVKRGEAIT